MAEERMIIGVLTLELGIFEAMNLKDKRRVLKSLKDRMSSQFNISVAEVGHLNVLRRSVIGIAMVGNDGRFLDSALSKMVDFVRRVPQVVVMDYSIECV